MWKVVGKLALALGCGIAWQLGSEIAHEAAEEARRDEIDLIDPRVRALAERYRTKFGYENAEERAENQVFFNDLEETVPDKFGRKVMSPEKTAAVNAFIAERERQRKLQENDA
tara:strand:+ start:834 stop:1172 length:339 start_codon:yes stop_codon:yes gene_type:complete